MKSSKIIHSVSDGPLTRVPKTGQIVSSEKLSEAPASTIDGWSRSQDCFRSVDTCIDTVGNEFSV